jgi:hypothetical protein
MTDVEQAKARPRPMTPDREMLGTCMRYSTEAEADAIRALLDDHDRLSRQIEELTRERDRAIKALKIAEPSQDVREAIHDEIDAVERAEQAEARLAAVVEALVDAKHRPPGLVPSLLAALAAAKEKP